MERAQLASIVHANQDGCAANGPRHEVAWTLQLPDMGRILHASGQRLKSLAMTSAALPEHCSGMMTPSVACADMVACLPCRTPAMYCGTPAAARAPPRRRWCTSWTADSWPANVFACSALIKHTEMLPHRV